MQFTLTTELIYLLIGAGIGLILGINLSVIYSRVFGARSGVERKLQQQIRKLEQRIKDKDRYIREALRSANREGADSR